MGDWLQDRCNSIQKAQQEHIQKSFGEDIEKARAGTYKPTKANLKTGKAGQKYGNEKKEDVHPIKHYQKMLDDIANRNPDIKDVSQLPETDRVSWNIAVNGMKIAVDLLNNKIMSK